MSDHLESLLMLALVLLAGAGVVTWIAYDIGWIK